ncbi:recombinase family protein [Microbacterium sp. LWH10-1.2]|uniref:recombinase family protein n=1 Tax=Microbacterium sp. LWH10-1.2 TaxID=3135255 RepID=UPI003139F0C7
MERSADAEAEDEEAGVDREGHGILRGMSRTALYLRISRDSEKLGRGVSRQRKECLELAARAGLNVVAEFEDNDISASRYSRKTRPEFERMLERAEAGDFDTLLAWDLDRLIRKPVDGERIITLNEKAALNVRTVFDTVDLRSPNGVMFLRIKVAVSAQESDLKGQRVKAAHRQRLEEGKPISGRTPFGWKVGGLELEPKEADAIREGVAHVLAGGSIFSLQKSWNTSGLFGPSGKPWSASSVKNVLRRWRNAGVVEHRGEPLEVKSQIEPIVSRGELEEIRLKLELQPSPQGRPLAKSWLSGVMKCGVCGEKMLPRKQFYQCSVSTERTQKTTEERHVAIAKHLAEHRVMMALYFEANHRARWGTVEAADVDRVRAIEAELLEAQKDRQEATQMLFVKGVDKAVVAGELSRLDKEISRLERERLENRTASSEAARIADLMQGPTDTGTNFTGAWITYFESLTLEEKRDLARTLEITVAKGGKGAKRIAIQGEVEHFYLG